ncbi:MAG: hypothetical protein JWM31_133 [Solirubrobacterales bacterium]|nr:hypothetical protein [Solirubrobacterales bacterium]
MSTSESGAKVTRSIQFVGGVRIAYGIVALFKPRIWPKVFGIPADNQDMRAFNAFLGSRDIAIGLHSLAAKDPVRQRDTILINHACEVFDTVVNVQEMRLKRPFGTFTVAGLAFNAIMHAIWIRVHLLRRG